MSSSLSQLLLVGEVEPMVTPKDSSVIEFKALYVPTLTAELAANLEMVLGTLPGIKQFSISPERKELSIIFDKSQLDLRTLTREMAKAGCFLRDIRAAVLF